MFSILITLKGGDRWGVGDYWRVGDYFFNLGQRGAIIGGWAIIRRNTVKQSITDLAGLEKRP